MRTLEIVNSYKSKIGIIHDDFGASDLAFYAISYANKLTAESNLDVIGFYKNLPNPVIPASFALMNQLDIWGFDGLAIATDVDSAYSLSNTVSSSPKVFYVWDLEWLRHNKNFLYNVGAYRARNLKLVARSKDHADILSKYCNRPVDAIIENCNLFEFWKVFGVK